MAKEINQDFQVTELHQVKNMMNAVGLIDAKIGSINSIAESLTNIVWAPLKDRINSVSLSANWMWPCGNEGEDSRLYDAVEACSDFAISLGINIPTGKDSLSMVQKYDNIKIKSPGTVIISAAGQCSDVKNIIKPVATAMGGEIFYVDFSQDEFYLGGSSFAQSQECIGNNTPGVTDAVYFKRAFNTVQDHIKAGKISAGHDIGSGGLITSLLEFCFPSLNIGMDLDFSCLEETDLVKILFSEKAKIIQQKNIFHGYQSEVKVISNKSIFQKNSKFKVGRYHSLKLKEPFSAKNFEITIRCSNTGIAMGFENIKDDVYGFQFHPESFLTKNGKLLIKKILSA